MIDVSNTSEKYNVPKLEISSRKYNVKLAETREEVEQALKLRFDVFNIELGEGLDESFATEMDEDKFDEQCHHLVVIDNDSNEVIGTYRMQTSEMASAGEGFYTQGEFDLTQFPDQIISNAVELGRACIHRDHRNGRVLFLLWRGLAKYLVVTQKRYLFGCCSLTSQDPNEGLIAYNYLKKRDLLHPDFQLIVQDAYECLEHADASITEDEMKLPQLFRLYIDQKAKVCSPPALDKVFSTIDFLILLDVEELSEQSRTLFFK